MENNAVEWQLVKPDKHAKNFFAYSCFFSLNETAVHDEEPEAEPMTTERGETLMRSQMLCELQRVKKEMVDNSQLVSKPEV